ncbi:hypothetical protein, partial [Serratia marcescens]
MLGFLFAAAGRSDNKARASRLGILPGERWAIHGSRQGSQWARFVKQGIEQGLLKYPFSLRRNDKKETRYCDA